MVIVAHFYCLPHRNNKPICHPFMIYGDDAEEASGVQCTVFQVCFERWFSIEVFLDQVVQV